MGTSELECRNVGVVVLEDTGFRTWLQLLSYTLACQTRGPRICRSWDVRSGCNVGGSEVRREQEIEEREERRELERNE